MYHTKYGKLNHEEILRSDTKTNTAESNAVVAGA